MVIKYFECSFSKIYPPKFGLGVPFPQEEPCQYPVEKGVWNWVNVRDPPGTTTPWLPNGGNIRLVQDPSDLSRACAEFIMDCPGTRPLPENQSTKLYELQERQSANYVAPYTTLKEGYWNLNYWVPSNLKVNNWRLLWQNCGESGVYGAKTYAPQMALFLFAPMYGNGVMFTLDSYYWPDHSGLESKIMDVSAFPKNRWVPITVYVKQGSSFQSLDGTVIIWIDGVKVFERHDLPTATETGTPYVIWGIGNYGGGEEDYGQTMFFKDIVVASERITTPVGATHILTLTSPPVNGVPIAVNGTQYVTPANAVVGETPPTVVSAPSTFTQAGQDYVFAHWEDGSTNPTRTLNVTSDMVLTATYQLAPPTQYTLTILASDGGTTNPPPGVLTLNAGTVQPVIPLPAQGYKHKRWIFDGIDATPWWPPGSTINVTMDADHTLAAEFEIDAVTIIAQASYGGSVSPAGQIQMIIGQTYSFAAIPTVSLNHQFDYWDLGGTNRGSTNPLQLIADASMDGKTLTAVFTTIPPVQITVNIATLGNGSVNLANGPHTFNVGDTVTLTASPAPNNTFIQWTLDGTIYTRNPVDIPITQSMDGLTLTADFRLTAIVLTVQADAYGTVNPSGTLLLQVGQSYLFQATPDPGYMLDRWDLSDKSLGSTNPLTITTTESMDNQTLKATFTTVPPPQINMNLAVTGSGQTNPAEGAHVFNIGDTITFTAIPAAGQTFKQWTLDGTVQTANPLPLLIEAKMQGMTLTAEFTGPEVPPTAPTIFDRAWTAFTEFSGSLNLPVPPKPAQPPKLPIEE